MYIYMLNLFQLGVINTTFTMRELEEDIQIYSTYVYLCVYKYIYTYLTMYILINICSV